jgi:hypothetical protein
MNDEGSQRRLAMNMNLDIDHWWPACDSESF